jgi:uncharacterized CHY-type Zn-finger protein
VQVEAAVLPPWVKPIMRRPLASRGPTDREWCMGPVLPPHVYGHLVDTQSRCQHYPSDRDIVAIQFKCCRRYYACFHCHASGESHAAKRWSPDEFSEPAVLCGTCGQTLTIAEYFACDFRCPSCAACFNPRCADHYALYFAIDER